MSLIYFEQLIESGINQIVGNPLIFGAILFILFFAMIMLLRLSNDAIFMISVPIFFLLSLYIPGLFLVFALATGVIIGMFFLRIVRR